MTSDERTTAPSANGRCGRLDLCGTALDAAFAVAHVVDSVRSSIVSVAGLVEALSPAM